MIASQPADAVTADDVPLRRCIACRRRSPREETLRFVAAPDGQVVLDPLMRLPGRGAHACPSLGCIERAVERGAFARSLGRAVVVPPPAELASAARVAATRRAHELFGLLRRVGGLEIGARAVLARLGQGDLAFVVISTEHAARGAADVERAAGRAGVAIGRFSTGLEVGHAIGRGPTGVVGAVRGRLAEALSVAVTKSNRLAPAERAGSDEDR